MAAIRPIPLPPHASERVFGSKYSFAVIDAARFSAASEEEQARVASGFFNDLFWFDQMACSSPHVVFWIGATEAAESAAHDFERVLQTEVARRKFEPPVSSAVHRRTYAFGLAASSDVRVVLVSPRNPLNVGAAAQSAGVAALEDQAHIDAARRARRGCPWSRSSPSSL